MANSAQGPGFSMKVDDYVYVRHFEDFCLKLESVCRAHFGKPDKLIIDTNIYLFFFEKGKFRLCIDSSESYCYPNDPDVYARFIYHDSTGHIFVEELEPVNIRQCAKINKACIKQIKTAAVAVRGPRLTGNVIMGIKAILFFAALYIVGMSIRAAKRIKNMF